MSIESAIKAINDAGLYVANLFQSSMRVPIKEKHWRCNLIDEKDNLFEVGTGPTPEEALQAALKKAGDKTPRNNGMPTFLTKAAVNVKEPKKPTLDDL